MSKDKNKERKRLSSTRKQEIKAYADMVLAMHPQSDRAFDWASVCKKENIRVFFEDFPEDFDALIVYRKQKYSIFVNTKNLDDMPEYRVNFTICHELGHYFLPEHRYKLEREGMMQQQLRPETNGRSVEEREADVMASCLMMPAQIIAADFAAQSFTPAFILEVANRYKVSRDACLMRYVEFGPNPIMLVFSENGRTDQKAYHKKSKAFPLSKPLDMGEGRLPHCCLASAANNGNLLPELNVKRHRTAEVFGSFMPRNTPLSVLEYCVPMHVKGRFLSVFYFGL
jgi:Zn-dependent peptidase ImmA (M78 family)